MKNAKGCYTLFIVIFIYSFCNGQQTYTFKYDENGNRESRTIYFSDPETKSTRESDTKNTKEWKETIDELEIIIYLNPTNGMLRIDLVDFKGILPSSISVFDFSGHLIINKTNLQNINVIDLTHLPEATYLLRIKAEGKSSEWKIIKE